MKKVVLAVVLTAFSFGVKAQLKVASNGKVGIGTLSPHTIYPVTVQQNTNNYGDGALLVRSVDANSSFYIGQYAGNAHLGSTTDVLALYHWYTAYQRVYAQSYSTASDRKIKDNIQSIENGLDYIMKLRGVSYNLKEDLENGLEKTIYGFISQEVQEILPELTSEQMDILCLDYQQIIPFLVRGMQEQQNQISELKNQMDELKKLVFNIA